MAKDKAKWFKVSGMAKRLVCSAAEVQEALIELGLQVRNDHKSPELLMNYLPTEAGEKRCREVTMSKPDPKGRKIVYLEWSEPVFVEVQEGLSSTRRLRDIERYQRLLECQNMDLARQVELLQAQVNQLAKVCHELARAREKLALLDPVKVSDTQEDWKTLAG